MSRGVFSKLFKDERGAYVIEFVFVTPVMLVLLMGFLNITYNALLRGQLSGALQAAARASTMEGGGLRNDEIDAGVLKTIRSYASRATMTTTRESYENFGQVKPESFTDTNANGRYDATECFADKNANRLWDAKPRGRAGQGGADDVVVYEVTIVYPNILPVLAMADRKDGWGVVSLSPKNEIKAKTIIKNQPFASQILTTAPPVVTVCP